jgi:hypothetical protein
VKRQLDGDYLTDMNKSTWKYKTIYHPTLQGRRWIVTSKNGKKHAVGKYARGEYNCVRYVKGHTVIYLDLEYDTQLELPRNWRIYGRVGKYVYVNTTQQNVLVWDTTTSAIKDQLPCIYTTPEDEDGESSYYCMNDPLLPCPIVGRSMIFIGRWVYEIWTSCISVSDPDDIEMEICRFDLHFGLQPYFTLECGILTMFAESYVLPHVYDLTELERIRVDTLESLLPVKEIKQKILSYLVLEEEWAWRDGLVPREDTIETDDDVEE